MLICDVFVLVQDTGISVRKRVIKIFRDICMDQPEFPKIPEMCVRMIRRVNDEEGIKVTFLSEIKSFQCDNLWENCTSMYDSYNLWTYCEIKPMP